MACRWLLIPAGRGLQVIGVDRNAEVVKTIKTQTNSRSSATLWAWTSGRS